MTLLDGCVSEDKDKNNHACINSKTHSNHIFLCCTVHVRKHNFLPHEEDVLRFHKKFYYLPTEMLLFYTDELNGKKKKCPHAIIHVLVFFVTFSAKGTEIVP